MELDLQYIDQMVSMAGFSNPAANDPGCSEGLGCCLSFVEHIQILVAGHVPVKCTVNARCTDPAVDWCHNKSCKYNTYKLSMASERNPIRVVGCDNLSSILVRRRLVQLLSLVSALAGPDFCRPLSASPRTIEYFPKSTQRPKEVTPTYCSALWRYSTGTAVRQAKWGMLVPPAAQLSRQGDMVYPENRAAGSGRGAIRPIDCAHLQISGRDFRSLGRRCTAGWSTCRKGCS